MTRRFGNLFRQEHDVERGPIDLDVFEAEESKTTIGVKAEPFSQGVDGKGDKSMARRIPNDRTGRGDVNVQLAFTATAVFGVEEFPTRCSLDAERDRAGKEMCPCPTGVEPGAQAQNYLNLSQSSQTEPKPN